MLDNKIILAPAKLNIFLKILGKRKDGYHEIRSGITYVNLFDQIEIKRNHETIISYSGNFQPINGYYNDCIIKKTLIFLKIDKKISLKINIVKNIPVQGGLGSASTNAASLILALQEMNIISKKEPAYYSSLGADIPCFLYKKDSLATGIGEKLSYYPFPKYFFLLVKPTFNNSTQKMYKALNVKNFFEADLYNKDNNINEEDNGNDFEILMKKNIEYKKIIDFLDSFDQKIFTRMTGSGSCVYAAFKEEAEAFNAQLTFQKFFKNLWTIVVSNNIYLK